MTTLRLPGREDQLIISSTSIIIIIGFLSFIGYLIDCYNRHHSYIG